MNLKNIVIALGVGTAGVLTACSGANGNQTESGLDIAKFDTIVDNKPVKLYTLKNSAGMEVCVTNYGAHIVSVMAQDKNGVFRDVVLGYDNISQYVDANKNQVYDVNEQSSNDSTLVLGLSGDAKTTVTYTLTSENTLDVKVESAEDAKTGDCLFNLSGDPSVAGTNMVLYINADNYSPADSTLTATGEMRSVYGNQFDFRQPKALYTCIADTAGYNGIQVRYAGGFDHNWCLNTCKNGKCDDTKVAASLYSPDSGIFMQVYTDKPGMQCSTANNLDGKKVGKRGIAYPLHAAVSFVAQQCPVTKKMESAKANSKAEGNNNCYHVVYKFSVK